MLYKIMEKYNLRKIIKEGNVEVFCNNVICVNISKYKYSYRVKVEYKDSFTKWTEAMYERLVFFNSTVDFNRLEVDIDRIISRYNKA